MCNQNICRVVDEIMAVDQVHGVFQQDTGNRHQRVWYRDRHRRRVVEVARALLRRINLNVVIQAERFVVLVFGEIKVRKTVIVTKNVHPGQTCWGNRTVGPWCGKLSSFDGVEGR